MKDCKVLFKSGQEHEFALEDMGKALKYYFEHKDTVLGLRTPYGTISLLDDETFDTALGLPIDITEGLIV